MWYGSVWREVRWTSFIGQGIKTKHCLNIQYKVMASCKVKAAMLFETWNEHLQKVHWTQQHFLSLYQLFDKAPEMGNDTLPKKIDCILNDRKLLFLHCFTNTTLTVAFGLFHVLLGCQFGIKLVTGWIFPVTLKSSYRRKPDQGEEK
jgi:hypothetical protein